MRRGWTVLLALACLAAGWLAAQTASSQSDAPERSYRYRNIETVFRLRSDSTVAVKERLTFAFTGSYHSAWRSLSLDRLGAITDIAVLDGITLQPLRRSSKRLDKSDPESWGSYAVWRSEGSQNIEWYYDLADTGHTWILSYVMHGAIEFGREQDRFYYDVFTDYEAPVDQANVAVVLPVSVPEDRVVRVAYTTAQARSEGAYEQATGTAVFSAQGFRAHDDFTVDVGFPAGLVSRSAYWRDWLTFTWGFITAALALLAAIAAMAIRWYVTERKPKGRGTIIPRYEPPQALKPAMAEVICTERLTGNGLAATVVDLAIRGYVQIEEDARTGWLAHFGPKHYRLIKLRDNLTDTELEDYEREYLGILFGLRSVFATREVSKWSDSDKRRLHRSIEELKRSVLRETETDTGAYEVGPHKEQRAYGIGLALLVFGIIAGAMLASATGLGATQPVIALAGLLVGALLVWGFFRYEARLTHAGRILKEDWLGFKMFLATAERFRLQNLTPETFERFLPYAMVFRIEKKWAKAFDAVHLPPPAWYAGTAGSAAMAGGGGFSASAFSASFASSFTSAFASSGGGGGAGGGGAGGGGGGGGGGAG